MFLSFCETNDNALTALFQHIGSDFACTGEFIQCITTSNCSQVEDSKSDTEEPMLEVELILAILISINRLNLTLIHSNSDHELQSTSLAT